MINQQLIDYIKKESQRGVLMESTKNALLAIGWTEKDIKKAYDSLSTSDSPSGFNKKFIWIPLLLLLIIVGGVFGYMYYTSNNSVVKIQPVVNTPTPLPVPTPTLPLPEETVPISTPPSVSPENPAPTPVVISDTDKVATIMTDICQGFLTSNNSLIMANASAQTIGLIANMKLGPVGSCTVNKIYQSGANIIANLTITPSDKPSTELLPIPDMVFTNEGGGWKFDLAESVKFTTEQSKIKILSGDPNGFVDLTITGIVISPTRPIVNKKDVKITITVKNMGTKTSDTGTPLVVNLEGFKDSISLNGGNYEPLLAGGTTEWIFYPYKYNNLFKVSDVAGQKTIKIELNPDRKIAESNYENNIFTKTVQMYAK